MKEKPTKWGVKFYVLCKSNSGYTGNFEIMALAPGISNKLHVVLWLNQGYSLYTDNYYCNLALCDTLAANNTMVVSTVRSNRTGLRKNLMATPLAVGNMDYMRRNQLVAINWKDKREVQVLTTKHLLEMVPHTSRTETKLKPSAIVDYSKNMGGVNRSDQLISYMPLHRKTIKWWKKVAFHLLSLCLVQSCILYNCYLEIVSCFKYLGCKISTSGSLTEAISDQINSARRALFSLKCFLSKNKDILPSTQIKLFEALVTPILFYGCEVWGLRKSDPMERFYLMFLKNILHVKNSTPIPGHAFLPCDRDFGVIEKKKRKTPAVYTPQGWFSLVRCSKKKKSANRVIPVHEACAYFYNAGYSSRSWTELCQFLLKFDVELPSRNSIDSTKQNYHPQIFSQEIKCDVMYSDLIKETVQWLIEAEKCAMKIPEGAELELVAKTGIDGSGCHKVRHQIVDCELSMDENLHLDPSIYTNYLLCCSSLLELHLQ